MKFVVKRRSKNEIEGVLKHLFGIYNPDFSEEKTPSSEESKEIILNEIQALDKEYYIKLNDILTNSRRNGKGMDFKSAQIVVQNYDRVREGFSVGRMDRQNQFSYEIPKSISKGKRKRFFDDLIDNEITYIDRMSRTCFLLHATPCFFENEDLEFNPDFFINPKKFSLEDGNHKGLESEYQHLRKKIVDGKRTQKVDMKLFVRPDKSIRVKYIVHNKADKLDVVVNIYPEERKVAHYHLELRNPREKTIYPSTTIELVKSERGNFNFRGNVNEQEFREYKTPTQIEDDQLYSLVTKNPILLGGNAFLGILDELSNRYKKIVEATETAKRFQKENTNPPIENTEFNLKNLERKVNF